MNDESYQDSKDKVKVLCKREILNYESTNLNFESINTQPARVSDDKLINLRLTIKDIRNIKNSLDHTKRYYESLIDLMNRKSH